MRFKRQNFSPLQKQVAIGERFLFKSGFGSTTFNSQLFSFFPSIDVLQLWEQTRNWRRRRDAMWRDATPSTPTSTSTLKSDGRDIHKKALEIRRIKTWVCRLAIPLRDNVRVGERVCVRVCVPEDEREWEKSVRPIKRERAREREREREWSRFWESKREI